MMETTLNKIRENSPCKSKWKQLLRDLKKEKADDEPVKISNILEIYGLDDALWCLRAVDGYEKEKRLFAVWCARRVEKNIKDIRTINAINVAEKFAYGQASEYELAKAWASADLSYEAGWTAEKNAAKAAFSSAKWFAAFANSKDQERSAQEKEFRRVLSI
jgi:hypothetical protein